MWASLGEEGGGGPEKKKKIKWAQPK
jgi:hypothetical protein